jgi:SAM-dependent methyltransferase
MTQTGSASIDLPLWLQSPPGRYLLAWEQQRIDAHVADVFGFHALQLGLPELDALRANRMPHRWLACVPGHPMGGERNQEPEAAGSEGPSVFGPLAGPGAIGLLQCEAHALPFPNHSLDLIVLPHTLELAADAHQTLREVERVLVPEGRLVILGFNPHSLWGLRQWGGRLAQRLGAAAPSPSADPTDMRADSGLFMPRAGEFIALRRLRDWLRLLSFEVERGGFGCYRPPLASQAWLDRYAWIEKAGDRWWPMLGAVYMVSAVKRVRGMRIIAPAAGKRLRKARAASAVASTTHRDALGPGDSGEQLLRRLRRLAEDQP